MKLTYYSNQHRAFPGNIVFGQSRCMFSSGCWLARTLGLQTTYTEKEKPGKGVREEETVPRWAREASLPHFCRRPRETATPTVPCGGDSNRILFSLLPKAGIVLKPSRLSSYSPFSKITIFWDTSHYGPLANPAESKSTFLYKETEIWPCFLDPADTTTPRALKPLSGMNFPFSLSGQLSRLNTELRYNLFRDALPYPCPPQRRPI